MTKRLRHRLSLVGQLAALFTTSYFLIATSRPADYPTPYFNSQVCTHPAQSVIFGVTSTCGPVGIITVSSPLDECFVTVAGAAAVGLPGAGRFDGYSGERSMDLLKDAWTLSDTPPDPAITSIPVPPVPPVYPDAGVAVDTLPDSTFAVATDGATRSTFGVVDAYSAAPTPIAVAFHPAPQKRECRVTAGNQSKFSCTGVQICAGTLLRR